jgi:phosphoribosylpyrophosphate synthetase
MATNSIKLLTGSSHPQLAELVASRLGIELAKIMVLQYSNNESSISIGESVRDEDGMTHSRRPEPNENKVHKADCCAQSSCCSRLPPATSTMESWSCSS